MNNKKLTIILAILAIVAVTLVVIAAMKSGAPSRNPINKPSAGQSASQSSVTKSSGDADIDAMETDLKSIDDADFDESGLADTEVGL